MVILASISTALTMGFNIYDAAVPSAEGNPLAAIGGLVIPLLSMGFLLFAMFFQRVADDAHDEQLERIEKKLDMILGKDRTGNGNNGKNPVDSKKDNDKTE